jgi:O-antigen/teichoic acid export membrane protein
MNNRTGRSISNLFSSLVLQIVSLLIGLVSTPLLLHFLGDDRYGAFRAASDWAGYINLLQLGMGGSLMALLATAVGKGEPKLIRLTLATGIRTYAKILMAMLAVAMIMGFVITHLVQAKGDIAIELQKGYWIGFLGIFLLPLTPFQLISDASQKSYIVNIFFILQSIIITSLTLIFAWLGWGIPGQYLATLIGYITFRLGTSWRGLRQYPDIFASVLDKKSQAEINQKLWQLNWPTLILNIAGQVSLLTDNIIISLFMGPTLVVPFFVTQRLSSLAQSQVQGIGNATWAALSELHAKGEKELFNQRLIELSRIVSVMGLSLILPIMIYTHKFVDLWVGESRFGGQTLVYLAGINGILQGLFSLWGWCFGGTGNISKVVPLSITGTIVNLSMSLIFTHYLGIIGPVLGSFIAFITVNSWGLPLLLNRTFGSDFKQLYWALLKPLSFGIPYGFLLHYFANSHSVNGWINLGAEISFTSIFFVVIAWFFIFTKGDRKIWQARFKSITNRSKPGQL